MLSFVVLERLFHRKSALPLEGCASNRFKRRQLSLPIIHLDPRGLVTLVFIYSWAIAISIWNVEKKTQFSAGSRTNSARYGQNQAIQPKHFSPLRGPLFIQFIVSRSAGGLRLALMMQAPDFVDWEPDTALSLHMQEK